MKATKMLWPDHYNPPTFPAFNFLERAEIITGLSRTQIRFSGDQTRWISRIRQAIAHVMHDKLGRSYGEIGRSLNRNHTTIIHNVKLSRHLVTIDDDHRALVDSLEAVA